MAGSEFDWSSDVVIFRSIQAVAVYVNTHGDIVIRQQGDTYSDEDVFVVVPPSQVQNVVRALQDAAKEAGAVREPAGQ